jgi:hypothetical protein
MVTKAHRHTDLINEGMMLPRHHPIIIIIIVIVIVVVVVVNSLKGVTP